MLTFDETLLAVLQIRGAHPVRFDLGPLDETPIECTVAVSHFELGSHGVTALDALTQVKALLDTFNFEYCPGCEDCKPESKC